jgi:hypothetical protein
MIAKPQELPFQVTVLSLLLIACFSSARAQDTASAKNLKLTLEAGELRNGVPDKFIFIFRNVSDHDVRMPPVGPCSSDVNGWLRLQLDYKYLVDEQGSGGGCGGGAGDQPGILEIAKSWKTLSPGQSLRIKESRRDMFQNQDCAGKYDFWAEYTPPRFSAAEVESLTKAGIDFPHQELASEHLEFTRKP